MRGYGYGLVESEDVSEAIGHAICLVAPDGHGGVFLGTHWPYVFYSNGGAEALRPVRQRSTTTLVGAGFWLCALPPPFLPLLLPLPHLRI